MKMYRSNQWTHKDRQVLKDFYNIKPIEELAELLSVPIQMVEVHPTHERLEVSIVHMN